jgi:hypothetical protein
VKKRNNLSDCFSKTWDLDTINCMQKNNNESLKFDENRRRNSSKKGIE